MPPELELIDDLPEKIPITQRELDVVETYIGRLLNDVFENQSHQSQVFA